MTVQLPPHDDNDWTYGVGPRISCEEADLTFQYLFKPYMSYDPARPGWIYECDLGFHQIESYRDKLMREVQHPDAKYFAAWQETFFKNYEFGKCIVDRLIGFVSSGIDVR